MKLYEINQAVNDLLENEELTDLEMDQLEQLAIAESEKLESIGCYLKHLKSESDAIANEIKTLQQRKKAIDNKHDRLKTYLSDYLIANGRDSFKTSKVVISFRSSKSVNVYDENVLPDAVKTYEIKIDKKMIGDLIKAGQDIAGAELVENKNIQVR